MADPAPSTDEAQDKPGQQPPSPPKVDSATFANTKQHVADQQSGDDVSGRFVNTKLNIALINDPKNGPRFTMTKRESGLEEQETADGGEEPKKVDEGAPKESAEASPETSDARHTSKPSKSEPSSAEPSAAESDAAASLPSGDRPDDPTRSDQPGDPVEKAAPIGVPPAAEPPSKVPVDSSKTFIGPNGTYYDESWRWMDWRGTRQSWNWPAAFSFGHWFAYRRLYLFAGLYLLWLTSLAAATVNNVPVLAVAVVALLIVGLTGVYGNTLYFRAFRRAVDRITETGEGDYQELQGQLARAGGTSWVAPGVMGALTIGGMVAALGITYQMRGGFQVNLWPF